MRLLLAGLAVGSLLAAGCSTKVGVAAVYDGHTITDSQVAQYLTTKAQPVPGQDAQGNATQVPARVFVLGTLLTERVYTDILHATPDGLPDANTLDAVKKQAFGDDPEATVTAQLAKYGYHAGLTPHVINEQVLLEVIREEVQNGGLDINAVLKKVHPKVTVSPRYGAWDPQQLRLSSDPRAGLPDFVTLHTQPAEPATTQ
jgi:hypothetical protein